MATDPPPAESRSAVPLSAARAAGEALGTDAVLEMLRSGRVEVMGRMPWSSNATFLVAVTHEGTELPAIYKPRRGERALWDFPGGLFRREVAAYELATALGWRMVPETLVRHDAPFGEGSLQRFVEADFDEHYFTLLEDEDQHAALRRMACFDLLANNADRKGGHCLLGVDGHLWGIDHGLCFHPDPKLRTVIWDFAGEPVDDTLVADVRRLGTCGLPAALTGLLELDENRALAARMRNLVKTRRYPPPRTDHPYPWPLV